MKKCLKLSTLNHSCAQVIISFLKITSLVRSLSCFKKGWTINKIINQNCNMIKCNIQTGSHVSQHNITNEALLQRRSGLQVMFSRRNKHACWVQAILFMYLQWKLNAKFTICSKIGRHPVYLLLLAKVNSVLSFSVHRWGLLSSLHQPSPSSDYLTPNRNYVRKVLTLDLGNSFTKTQGPLTSLFLSFQLYHLLIMVLFLARLRLKYLNKTNPAETHTELTCQHICLHDNWAPSSGEDHVIQLKALEEAS